MFTSQATAQELEEKICTIKPGCKFVIKTVNTCNNFHQWHGACTGGFLQGHGILDTTNLNGEPSRSVLNTLNGKPVGLHASGSEGVKEKLSVYRRNDEGRLLATSVCSYPNADQALCQEGFEFFRKTILEKGAGGWRNKPDVLGAAAFSKTDTLGVASLGAPTGKSNPPSQSIGDSSPTSDKSLSSSSKRTDENRTFNGCIPDENLLNAAVRAEQEVKPEERQNRTPSQSREQILRVLGDVKFALQIRTLEEIWYSSTARNFWDQRQVTRPPVTEAHLSTGLLQADLVACMIKKAGRQLPSPPPRPNPLPEQNNQVQTPIPRTVGPVRSECGFGKRSDSGHCAAK